jgi:hypothetical protein
MVALLATVDRATRSVKPMNALAAALARQLLPERRAGACIYCGQECRTDCYNPHIIDCGYCYTWDSFNCPSYNCWQSACDC